MQQSFKVWKVSEILLSLWSSILSSIQTGQLELVRGVRIFSIWSPLHLGSNQGKEVAASPGTLYFRSLSISLPSSFSPHKICPQKIPTFHKKTNISVYNFPDWFVLIWAFLPKLSCALKMPGDLFHSALCTCMFVPSVLGWGLFWDSPHNGFLVDFWFGCEYVCVCVCIFTQHPL